MRTQRIRYLWVLALALLMLLVLPTMAQVNGVSGIDRVSGELAAIQPPASIADGSRESDTTAFIFLERENAVLQSPLRVDITEPGFYDKEGQSIQSTIRAGSDVNSYLIHVDPSPRFIEVPLPRGFRGSVTFDEPVVGIIVQTARLISSSDVLGAPNTIYTDMSGLEFTLADLGPEDELELTESRRTINFEFRDRTEIDQIRVITSEDIEPDVTPPPPPPGSGNGNGDNDDSMSDDPNARDDDFTVRENRSIALDVLENDSDPNDNLDASTLRIVVQPENGTAEVDETRVEITYSPGTDFVGSDSLEYEICDETNLCDRAIVELVVSREGASDGSSDGESNLISRTVLPEAPDCSRFESIEIDIVPWNRENRIKLGDSIGTTAVGILGTQAFPVGSCVDISTVSFGPTGTEEFAISCGVANVDFDPWMDLLCDFRTSRLRFELEDTMGELQAETIDGRPLSASGHVTVVETGRTHNIESLRSRHNLEQQSHLIGQSLVIRAQVEDDSSLTGKLFSSSGELITSTTSSGQLLRLRMMDNNRAPLANGVYLVLLEARDRYGEIMGVAVMKLPLVR